MPSSGADGSVATVTTSGSLPAAVTVNRINLNDRTVEGMRHKTKPIFCVQYHPEASPGPHDSTPLFDEFRALSERQVVLARDNESTLLHAEIVQVVEAMRQAGGESGVAAEVGVQGVVGVQAAGGKSGLNGRSQVDQMRLGVADGIEAAGDRGAFRAA